MRRTTAFLLMVMARNLFATTLPPTHVPTSRPSGAPSRLPTISPTRAPTKAPTLRPSHAPTVTPTRAPTKAPHVPTSAPTDNGGLGFKAIIGSYVLAASVILGILILVTYAWCKSTDPGLKHEEASFTMLPTDDDELISLRNDNTREAGVST